MDEFGYAVQPARDKAVRRFPSSFPKAPEANISAGSTTVINLHAATQPRFFRHLQPLVRKDSDFSVPEHPPSRPYNQGTTVINLGVLKERGSFTGIVERGLRADLRQLSECVYLPLAARLVGHEPALVRLPGMQKADRVL